MSGKYKIRSETNSRLLRVTNISRGHLKRIAFITSFPPAALLGSIVAAMIGGLLGLGMNTLWQWAFTIVASILACWFFLGLFLGFSFGCFVWAFNTNSGEDEDDSGVVVRVRELTEEEQRRDPESFNV